MFSRAHVIAGRSPGWYLYHLLKYYYELGIFPDPGTKIEQGLAIIYFNNHVHASVRL